MGEEHLGCSMASITENRFLPGPGWSVEPEEAPGLKKPTAGSHPTQTRSVTMNYFHGLWKLDGTCNRLLNKEPEGLSVVAQIPERLRVHEEVGGAFPSPQSPPVRHLM